MSTNRNVGTRCVGALLLLVASTQRVDAQQSIAGLWLGEIGSHGHETSMPLLVRVEKDGAVYWYAETARWGKVTPQTTSRAEFQVHRGSPTKHSPTVTLTLQADGTGLLGTLSDGRNITIRKLPDSVTAGQRGSKADIALKYDLELPLDIPQGYWPEFYFTQVASELIDGVISEVQVLARGKDEPSVALDLYQVEVSLTSTHCVVRGITHPVGRARAQMIEKVLADVARQCIKGSEQRPVRVEVEQSAAYIGDALVSELKTGYLFDGKPDFDRIWTKSLEIGQRVGQVEFDRSTEMKTKSRGEIRSTPTEFTYGKEGRVMWGTMQMTVSLKERVVEIEAIAEVKTRKRSARDWDQRKLIGYEQIVSPGSWQKSGEKPRHVHVVESLEKELVDKKEIEVRIVP
jgi:hypothetical protein